MRLTLINGSPRGVASNTMVFYRHFLKGFLAQPANSYEIIHLNQLAKTGEHVAVFAAAERVILAFPLYTDAMPGIVKAFLEALEEMPAGAKKPALGFIIQCGFPEALHLRPLEQYLEKLVRRLGCSYSGTIVKGAGEFIRVLPEILNLHIYRRFRKLGVDYGRNGAFSPKMIRRFAWYNRFPGWLLPFTWLFLDPIARRYWNVQLRKNRVFPTRFARPYLD